MIELTTTAANYLAVPVTYKKDGADGLASHVELILVYSEPTYRVDAAGGLIRDRAVGQFRFTASPAVLRHLAKQFTEYADESDKWFSDLPYGEKKKGAKKANEPA